jgi:hypothetical protein
MLEEIRTDLSLPYKIRRQAKRSPNSGLLTLLRFVPIACGDFGNPGSVIENLAIDKCVCITEQGLTALLCLRGSPLMLQKQGHPDFKGAFVVVIKWNLFGPQSV